MGFKNIKKKEQLLEIMELLRLNPQGLQKSEIAHYLGFHRSSVSDYLISLEDDGFQLWEDEDNRIGIFNEIVPKHKPPSGYDEPIHKLLTLLNAENNNESSYQQLFQNYPWILGTSYDQIVRHQKLDDENIPDFLGVRVYDQLMDIFEIKPPFMKIFRTGGGYTSEFNDSWNQAERYLAFAQIERDYLQRKGLYFDNPKCILIVGYNISQEEERKLRTKQRLNPTIQVLTYNHILALAKATVKLIKQEAEKASNKV